MAKQIYFAGGCFWGGEKYFSLIPGVIATETGYANGTTADPSYEQVCRGDSGFAETVKVSYNPQKIALPSLVKAFFEIIDPMALNRQGPDVGTQYRSGVYYTDAAERPVIEGFVLDLQNRLTGKIATEVLPLLNYYPAETCHQKYLDNNPYGYCHLDPALFAQAENWSAIPVYRRKSEAALQEELTELQYRVTQEGATERPFANEYYDEFREGIYVDVTTGEPLFISDDKFESGCGWPAFSKPISPSLVAELKDTSGTYPVVEVRSSTGWAHLGHVFGDGPAELGGLRYCINSAALRFIPKDDMSARGYGAFLKLLR